jgi:hypothetical protein
MFEHHYKRIQGGLLMGGFTEEEAEIYRRAIDELFQPTGRNLFDLKEEEDNG